MRLPLGSELEMRDSASRATRRVVVAVDFSPASLASAAWAARHFGTSAELTFVHVTSNRGVPNVSTERSGRPQARRAVTDAHERTLRGALYGLASIGGEARIDVEVRTGEPAAELAAFSDSVGADLIVTGPTATSPLLPSEEAATTERLLRRTARPVLIARAVQPSMTDTVLAAIGGDDDAPAVLGAARMIADPRGGRVAALHVVDGQPASRTLASVESWLRTAGIPQPRSVSLMAAGDIVRGIHGAARDLKAGVVVVGVRDQTRGAPHERRGIARSLVRSSTSSVLVVPFTS
jgi:nucleotide-binding universal stress UspA family protein